MATDARLALAALPARALAQGPYTSCLSDRERQRFDTLGDHRRQRFVAGRLAAKFLLLDGDRLGTAGVLQRLDSTRIHHYSAPEYRRLEILPEPDSNRPAVYRASRPDPTQVSLSHSGGVSYAAVSQRPLFGIDAEQVVARDAAFDRRTFAPEERRWMASEATATGLPRAWLSTLLWTLKEAALKARAWRRTTSLWDFPTLALRPRIESRTLQSLHRGRLGPSLTHFHALHPPDGRRMTVAVTATDRRILTLLHA